MSKPKRFIHILRNYSLLIILCMTSHISMAKDIYVDHQTGKDDNDGTLTLPYRSIQQAIDNTTNDEDNIYISAGVYRETLSINGKNNIRFAKNETSRGDVVISGLNIYKHDMWTSVDSKPGQYKLALKAEEVETSYTQVFCDGALEQTARYPDNTTGEMLNPTIRATGYAAIYDAKKPEGKVSTLTFDDKSSALPSNITDEFVLRGLIGKLRNNMFFAGSLGDELTPAGDYSLALKATRNDNVWSKDEAYEGKEGYGYLMDYSVLDCEGEWFHRKGEGYLYYQAKEGSLEDNTIEIKRREYAITLEQSQKIAFTDIHIKGAAVRAQSCNELNFNACSFQYMRPYQVFTGYGSPLLSGGITFEETSNSTIQNCYIAHTWTSGIVINTGSNNNTIDHCRIEDMGWIGLFTTAVYLNGGATIIRHNTFGRASRFHIRITSRQKMIITDNEFFGALAMGEDTGVIHAPGFTSSDPDFRGSEIAYNIIHDVYPMAAFDSKPGYNAAKVAAFYMEELGNYAMHHNVVYNIGTEEQQKSARGNYTAKVEGKIFFFPTQTRDMSAGLDVKFYNNTCWNYNLLYTSWMEKEGNAYGKYEVDWKNNLLMANALSGGNEAQIVLKRTGDIPTKKHYFETLAPLVAELNTAPWSSICSESNNRYLDRREAYNFTSTTNYEPKIPYNEGIHLPGYTQEDGEIELGAYEGSNQEERTRVSRAGSNLDPSLFPDYKPTSNAIEDHQPMSSITTYPNPAQDRLHLAMSPPNIPLSYTIYSISGQVKRTKQILASSIDISTLNSGMYILRINELNQQRVFIKH